VRLVNLFGGGLKDRKVWIQGEDQINSMASPSFNQIFSLQNTVPEPIFFEQGEKEIYLILGICFQRSDPNAIMFYEASSLAWIQRHC
jgi:hypothetical protein